MLPVSTSPLAPVPPDPLSGIKALPYDATAQGRGGALVQRIGAMLNLRLQGRDARIFLSHRASDGKKAAAQLHRHFAALGYRPWLDQAVDSDGNTSILPGTAAQRQIEQAISDASLVLLLDTPDAPASSWIRHEVETADALLVPLLPICFRAPRDTQHGPRFPILRSTGRWVERSLPELTKDNPLSDDDVFTIVAAAEQFLCEILQRRSESPILSKRTSKPTGTVGLSWIVASSYSGARKLTRQELQQRS